jgi:uroporphyrinogen decarboxylase
MNSFELIDSAIALKSTPRVPVAPFIISFAGRCSGFTQTDIFFNLYKWQQALSITFDRIGKCDAVFPLLPSDAANSQMMRVLLPGRNLDVDAQFQIIEEEVMTRDDYNQIISNGYNDWYYDYLPRVRADLSNSRFSKIKAIAGFAKQGIRIRRNVNYWHRRGIPAMFYMGCYPAFDLFSLTRSLEPFSYDLYECSEMVEKACKVATPQIVAMAKNPLRITGGKRVCIFPMRSSASFISPQMFERFSLPHLKYMVETFARDDIVSVLHCDGDWTPMLKYLRELPRASCVIELDNMTDIFKAKEILGDWLCLKGNVPATLLVNGEPDQVENYCRHLIKEVAYGGGFILSSGCEVPLNAKIENVRALVNSAK